MYESQAMTLGSATWKQKSKEELAADVDQLTRLYAGARQEIAAIEQFAASKIPLKAHPVLTSAVGVAMGGVHGLLEAYLNEWGLAISAAWVGAEALGAFVVSDPSWRALLIASATGKASGASAIVAKEKLKKWLDARLAAKGGASAAPKV